MLDFYGLRLVDPETGELDLEDPVGPDANSSATAGSSSSPASRFRHLERHPHNFLRITRILKCLGEVSRVPSGWSGRVWDRSRARRPRSFRDWTRSLAHLASSVPEKLTLTRSARACSSASTNIPPPSSSSSSCSNRNPLQVRAVPPHS